MDQPVMRRVIHTNGAEMAAERGTQSRGGPTVRMNWPLALHIDEKISQNGFAKACRIIHPFPKAVSLRKNNMLYTHGKRKWVSSASVIWYIVLFR
jgi:hypothetical protein